MVFDHLPAGELLGGVSCSSDLGDETVRSIKRGAVGGPALVLDAVLTNHNVSIEREV
jgi:hypothetical protein